MKKKQIPIANLRISDNAKKYILQTTNDLSNLVGLDLPYFFKGGFWLTSSMILSTIGGILLSSLFARLWPKDVYGQFSFLMSAVGFLSLTALPGMGQALIQSVAEGKEGSYRLATKTIAKFSVIGAIIMILGSVYFFLRQNPNLALATFLSALAFPITATASLYSSFLIGKKQFKLVAIYTTVAQFASITATAVALWTLSSFIWVAFFSAWSSAIVNVILTVFTYKQTENNLEDKSIIKLGIHLSFSQVFTIAADYLDRFLVPLLLGFTNNAIYAFAILIPMQLHTFFKTFLTLGQPKFAEISQKNIRGDLIKKSLQLEILIGSTVGAYIIAAPFIFRVLYPAYQGSAVTLSQIYSLSLLYYPGNLFSLSLIKFRLTKEILKTNILYSFTTALSLIILVSLFGLMGAVLAKIVSRTSQLAVQIFLFERKSKDHFR